MSKPVLLSLGAGKVQELVGTNDNDVLTWDAATSAWKAEAGGGGSGTVTSVGLTGGTSGIVIGGTASPITTSGTFNLDAPQRFAFDTTAPIAPTSPGQIAWNTAEGSLNTLMAGGNVDTIVGQQLYQRAVNNDTVTLTKGMVVYVDGSSGTRASVKRATADADLSSATILGVVAESIAQNAEGFIITNGLLKDLTVLPSTTFADGDVVYLSPTTAGGLTPTKPTAPDHLVMVGYCVKASNGAAGVLLVHPQNGYELGELHDVYINNPTSGQILIYDATAGQTRWENASLTAGTGVTVTPGAGSLSIAIGQAVGTGDSPTFVQVTTTARVVTDALRARTTVGSGFSLLKIDPVSGDTNVIVQPTSATTPVAAYFAGGSLSGTSPGTGAAGYFTGGGGGSGTGNGGDAYLRGGGVSGSGLTGRVYVGDSTSRSVDIGATGITTTLNGTVALANDLAVTEGGTGASSFTQYGVLVGNAANALAVTAAGTTNQYLKSGAGSANPAFATIQVAEVNGAAPLASPTFTGTPSLPTGTTGVTQSAGNNTTALATTAFVTTAVATAGGAPYDLPCEIPGTPDASKRVVNFEAVRPFILATTGHQGSQVTAPSGNFVCTVKKNATTLGTITFGTSSFSTNITGTLAERTFAAGDVLIVETPAASLGIDTPFWTFFMTLA